MSVAQLVAPRVAVGAVVFRGDEVLLVKRGRAPSRGLWAIPGGSVELGETLREAAEREVREETGIEIRTQSIVHTFDVIERDDAGHVLYHYVIVDFLADWIAGEPVAADDALDARWCRIADLDALAISSETLRLVRRLKPVERG